MEKIIEINDSIIQISDLNDRIYIMKLGKDAGELIKHVENVCNEKKLSKVFAKVPGNEKELFEKKGYVCEGKLKNYFVDDDVYFMSKFFDESRKISKFSKEVEDVLNYMGTVNEDSSVKFDEKFHLKIANETDAEKLSKHYSKVFETYPFPINDPNYILKTMQTNVKYFIIEDNGKIVAASSCEMDITNKCVEMTDFAVLEEYQKLGLSKYLLFIMEKIMKDNGYRVFYTIARSISYGMNITFKKMGYIYSGTAVNNTNICGKFEDMNFWYKLVE
ncbi:putative beta-lysine N-acetyltransferase [Methanococcus maripaludis]|uniref:Putative beta-lysine N-acetyltransferase n=1 Tax=Methanococcus maripaludis TaxID=39152 RepID=A0A7J9PT25_METMI|nr:putative beta-lysine N-acetyltransferase [Methanococcus maripaludis]MBA2868717.1 putative beta-lysine N-acetyltransferase [Methanococcus maripaludis]